MDKEIGINTGFFADIRCLVPVKKEGFVDDIAFVSFILRGNLFYLFLSLPAWYTVDFQL